METFNLKISFKKSKENIRFIVTYLIGAIKNKTLKILKNIKENLKIDVFLNTTHQCGCKKHKYPLFKLQIK